MSMRTERWPSLALAALLLLTALVYWPGLAGPFLLDDFGMIGALRAPAPGWEHWFDTLLASDLDYSRIRFLANISFIVSDILAGMPPAPASFPYKLANLLLHIASALALVAVARELLSATGQGRGRGPLAPIAALVAAALFLLHPLQVSTVLYAVQRMALMSALFSLLAVLAYLRWRRIAGDGGVADALRLWPVLLCAALALLSKENGALVFPLLLVVEHVALAGAPTPSPARRRLATRVFGTLTLAVLAAMAMQMPGWLASYTLRDFDLVERLATQTHVLLHYLGQILMPRVASMGLYFDDWPVMGATDPQAWAVGAALLVAAAVAWRGRRRHPIAAFAVLWFMVCHLLESTVVPLELVFEHRNYLAVAGFAVAFGAAVAPLAALWLRAFAVVTPIAVAALLSLPTTARVAQWSSEASFIAHERAARPQSMRARISEQALLLRAERVADAEALARDTLALDLDSANAAVPALTLGCGLVEWRDMAMAEALRRFAGPGLEGDADRHLAALVRSKAGGSCAGLAWSDLERIIATALANPITVTAARRGSQWIFVQTLARLAGGDAATALRSSEALTRAEPGRLRYLRLHWEAARAAGDAAALARVTAMLRERAAADPWFPRRWRASLAAPPPPAD